tara:strand:+ start:2123 stop:4774 length:2652 start_codon:yes stop_codon:yes gene_type:complete
MKNRFITILLILIFTLSFYRIAISEEFIFKVTDLEILENNTIYKGNNRGIVTTRNNEILITADTFIYNKLTTLLEAEGNVKVVDKIKDVIIVSNKIFYQKDKEKIYTIGESKATNGAGIKIEANEYFRYNRLTSLLEAKGDVVLDDRIENITIYTDEILYLQNEEKISTLGETNINIEKKYKIKGRDLTLLRDKMILSSKKKAIITDIVSNTYSLIEFEYLINQEILKGKTIKATTKSNTGKNDEYFFESAFFNLKENTFLAKDVKVKFDKSLFGNVKNDPRINAVSGHGTDLKKNFKKGVFTSCRKTDKCPPWKMTAKNIEHDKIKKQVIYKNAWLELYDIPVVYFPKFFHPDPSVKRQSGLIDLEIGDHNTLGDSIYLPYFFVISDNKDITIKPRLFKDGVIVLQNEYRQLGKNSLTIIDSSITKGHDSSSIDRGDNRSHFFANSKIKLNLDDYIGSNLEINYEKTSNDNYLKLFEFMKSPILQTSDVMQSYIKLDLQHQNYDFSTSIQMYETLNDAGSDRFQYVFPSYSFSKNFSLEKVINGSFNFSSSGNNTLQDTNIITSTIFNDLNYTSYDFLSEHGIKSNFEALFKNANSMGRNSPTYKDSLQSELLSAYNYNVSLPLIKKNNKSINKLTPRLSFRLSPHEMKDNSNNSRRIGIDNIFTTDRLSLGNSFEGGESLTLGMDFVKEKIHIKEEITEIKRYFDFHLATVLKLDDQKFIPDDSTLDKKRSNIFGQINFKPHDIFSLNYNFSLTNDFDKFEYNSLNTKFTFSNFSTQFNFVEERGVIGKTNIIENTTNINFNEYNSVKFATRRNREINLTEYYDLIYEYKNDCLIADIKYRKDYYSSNDIKPKEELFFSITIIPFYTYSPDKMILNKNRID